MSPKLLPVAGIPASTISSIGAWTLVRDILAEASGHCDYRPCVNPATFPFLGLALVGLTSGLIVLGFAVRR
jgi:hypothetical protein